MGVYDVVALSAIAAVQLERSPEKRACAGSELVQLHLDPIHTAQLSDLIAHELAALGVVGVGPHVRDDERAHALTVAVGADGDGREPVE